MQEQKTGIWCCWFWSSWNDSRPEGPKSGLNVLLIEKAATFGGSTARSGAGIWIRNNSVNNEAGLEDSFEEASEYLAQVVGDIVPLDKQESYLREGPKMLDFVMANSPLRFQYMKGYSDYYLNFRVLRKRSFHRTTDVERQATRLRIEKSSTPIHTDTCWGCYLQQRLQVS